MSDRGQEIEEPRDRVEKWINGQLTAAGIPPDEIETHVAWGGSAWAAAVLINHRLDRLSKQIEKIIDLLEYEKRRPL